MKKFAVLAISFILPTAFAIGGIIPELQSTLGLTQSQVDLFLSLPSIAIAIAVMLSNVVVSKVGVKKTVALGLVTIGLAGLFPLFVQNFELMLASRFMFGVGVGLMNPLAVSYISFLFDEKEVPKLIGVRGSIEFIGQSSLTILAGILLIFGWHMSFLVYALAFVLLVLFWKNVPDVNFDDASDTTTDEHPQKMPKLLLPILLFTIVVIMCAAAIGVRFPSLAAEAMGPSFNPSMLLAIQPLVNIFASLLFGRMHQLLGRKLLYISMMLHVLALLLVGFSNGHFWMIVLGFFIHGFVPGWTLPFILNSIAKITTGKMQNLAMSIVITGINAAIFVAPHLVGLIETALNATTITVAYPYLAVVITLILIALMTFGKRIQLETDPA